MAWVCYTCGLSIPQLARTSEILMKIGLFYGSTTCYTEIAAEKISTELQQHNHNIELFDIKDTPLTKLTEFDILVLGISTWDFGELQEDWESHWQDIDNLNLNNKTIAIYGMGDQIGYTDWFQDAVGMLHNKIIIQNANVIGYWPNQGQ